MILARSEVWGEMEVPAVEVVERVAVGMAALEKPARFPLLHRRPSLSRASISLRPRYCLSADKLESGSNANGFSQTDLDLLENDTLTKSTSDLVSGGLGFIIEGADTSASLTYI